MKYIVVFGCFDDGLNEDIKEEFGVVRVGGVFGMELNIEVGFVDVYDIFVVVVVGVYEEFLLVSGKGSSVNGIIVVLGSDVVFVSYYVCVGDVVIVVIEF